MRPGTGPGGIAVIANLWQTGDRSELSLNLMRYRPGAPDAIMEYLLAELILGGKQESFTWFNLGMAPLSGLENRHLAPLPSRAGNPIDQHGERFYNFRGLRS